MTDQLQLLNGYELGEELWRNDSAAFYSAEGAKEVTVALPVDEQPETLEKFALQQFIANKVSDVQSVLRLVESSDSENPHMIFDQVLVASLGSEIEDNGGLDWPEAVTVLTEIGSAIDRIHDLGIAHGSLSLDSIRVTKEGQPLISDFSTATLSKKGRPKSNEQKQLASLDFAADINSDISDLGHLFWSIVQGEEPPEESSELLSEILSDNVPLSICSVIGSAIDKNSSSHPSSVAEFLVQLNDASEEADAASVPYIEPPGSQTIMFDSLDQTGEQLIDPQELQVPIEPVSLDEQDEVIELVTNPADESRSSFPWFSIAATAVVTAMICIGAFALFSDSLLGRETVDDLVGMQLEEAEQALADKSIVIETQTGREDGSVAGQIISQIPRAGTVVDAGSVIRLTVSQGSELRELPDPTNLSTEEIASLLEAEGFVFGEVTEQRDSATVDAGKGIEFVLDGESIDGDLPGGSTLDLVVSTGVVTIPRISADQIEPLLEDELRLEVEIIEEFSDEIEVGEVIRTNPPTGSKVAPGSQVQVVLASDEDPPIESIPNVVGREVADAVNRIKDQGFTPAFVSGSPGGCTVAIGEARRRCQNAERGLVWKIEPEQEAFQGSTVTIFAPQEAIEEYKSNSSNDDDDDDNDD